MHIAIGNELRTKRIELIIIHKLHDTTKAKAIGVVRLPVRIMQHVRGEQPRIESTMHLTKVTPQRNSTLARLERQRIARGRMQIERAPTHTIIAADDF